MKVSLLKISGKNREVINRLEIEALAEKIRSGEVKSAVTDLRLMYHLMRTQRLEDGRIATDFVGGIRLPRICFAADMEHRAGERRRLHYNGLVVIEVNGLRTYEQAVQVRNQVSRLNETLMAFLGASGKSVKIVCRGELFDSGLPTDEADILQFHLNLYNTARQAYQNQFGLDIEYLEPRLDRTVYLSADPDLYFNPNARCFRADATKSAEQEPVSISWESDMLMPGRTITRTYHLNWLFVLKRVLGDYFELPDEDRLMTLLMRVATACLEEGIPMAKAQELTLEHPVLNSDPMLVKNVFSSVYDVALQADYRQKHKSKPLKSVPEDTIQTMRTEIFLNANFEMRKNLMTGVAEYRAKFAEDQTFKPLTEEVRNDMTLQAIEQGIKGWDQNVNRFIDSTRIEQYDPVNSWLDKLPEWDGQDRIKELAQRVPTDQPHWDKYLRMWLIGMVAQWRESDKQLTGNALTPLLIGRQGCGKTRFCKMLMPPELRDYYNDKLNFKNEFDLNIALTSFALINIDEFDKTTPSQQIVLKYLLSSSDVKFRPPYGKTIKLFRRYTSFIGTTNQQRPLVDPTGSRRFVCVGVTDGKNIDYTDNLEHRQLFAQALHLFNSGERFWLNDEEIAVLISENEPYQQTSDLMEMIGNTFRKPKPNEGRWWSSQAILDELGNHYASFNPKTVTFSKLGRAMSNRQFDFKSRRLSNVTEYWITVK